MVKEIDGYDGKHEKDFVGRRPAAKGGGPATDAGGSSGQVVS